MAVELATAYVSIVPSASGIRAHMLKEFGPDIDRAATDSGDRAGRGFGGAFGGHLKALAGIAAATFGAQAAFGFLKDSVSAASDLGETVSKATQIFGQDAVPALQRYAETAANTMGQSRQQALDAAATFGVFGKSAGLAGQDLVGFSTEMVGLSSDLASFGNTTVDEAIESIGAALRGESEPIRKYGILLDDATLRQRALSLGIISTTKDALTPAQKVLAAQAEILAQTSDAQGDFARTSGGLANQQRILAAQVSNLKARMGEALLPAMTALAKIANTVLVPALEGLVDVTGRGITAAVDIGAKAFGTLGTAWGDLVTLFTGGDEELLGLKWPGFMLDAGPAVGTVWTELTGGFNSFVHAFKRGDGDITSIGFPGFMEQVGFRVRQAWDAAWAAIDAFRGKVLEADTSITGTGLEAWSQRVGDNLARIRDIMVENGDVFVAATAGMAGFAATIITVNKAMVGINAANTALTGFGGLLTSLGPIIAKHPILILAAVIVGLGAAAVYAYNHWEPFRNVVDTIARVVRDVAVVAFERAGDALRALGSAASTGATAVRNALAPLMSWVATNLGPVFAAAGEFFVALFTKISEVVQGWWQLMQNVWGVIGPTVMAALEVVRTAIEAFVNVARPLLEGWLTAVWQYVSFVWDVVKNIIEAALGVIRGLITIATATLTGDWSKAWDGIQAIVTSVLSNLYDILRGVPGRILAALGNLGSTLWDSGRALIQGLIDGWGAALNLLSTALAGLPGWILGGIVGIGTWLYDAGRDLIQGFIDGIKGMAGDLKDAALGVVTGPVNSVKGFLGIGSPSRLFMEIGRDTMLGFELGMESMMGNLEDTGQAAASAVTGPIAAVRPTRAATGSLGTAGAGQGGSINHVTINTPNHVDPRGVVREWDWYRRTAGL